LKKKENSSNDGPEKLAKDEKTVSFLDKKVTRREALSTAGKAAIVVGAAVVVGGGAYAAYNVLQPAKPKVTSLGFTAWDYAVSTVQGNIDKFQTLNPNIKVTMTNFAYSDYQSSMAQRFTAGTPTHVTYDGEDWLAQWASSGWVVPLQDYWDRFQTKRKFSDYVSDMVPFARDSMTYKGKIYGLPYYSDTFNLMYNNKIFADNGIEVPKDWTDVTNAALKLKTGGMKFPYLQSFQGLSPFDFYQFFSGAMGRGATLLDASGNPNFNPSAGDPFFDQLKWLADGINKDHVINTDYTAVIESDVVTKMGAGEGAMTLLAKYNLAAMNASGTSPRAGQFSLGLMPGKTNVAYGFAKMYNMTKIAANAGDDTIQDCITYIEYFGANDSPVLKRWAVENGLGFGYVSPFNDPDISASIDKQYGQNAVATVKQQFSIAKGLSHPVWFGQWLDFANKEAILPALRQDITVEVAVDKMSKKATALNQA